MHHRFEPEPFRRVAVAAPDLTGNEEAYVVAAIRSGWVSSSGEFLDRFEREFAAACGTRHAVVALAICTRGRIDLLQREEGAAGAGPTRRHARGGHARPAKRPTRRRQTSGKRGREARRRHCMVCNNAQQRERPGEAHWRPPSASERSLLQSSFGF
jgi:hypothetical protein